MDVARWTTPAAFFSWPHVQKSMDRIDSTVSRSAIAFAQEDFLASTGPCPSCGRSAADLFWLSVSDPEAVWVEGGGRVGFLTACRRCQLQVDFLVDRGLTDIQAEQWRTDRTLS